LIDTQSTTQEELQQQAAFTEKVIKKLPYRRIVLAETDPLYTGGNPKVFMDIEDNGGTIPDERLPVIMPLAHTNAKPSGILVVAEVSQGEFAIIGELGDLPDGDLREGAHWTFITPGSASVSATAIAGRAQRLYNEQDLLVSSVSFEITTGGSGLVARVKLYSADGTLVIDTGDVDCTSTGIKSPAISPAVRITPGTYIAEITASATVAWRCADLIANLAAIMNAGTTQRAVNPTMGTPTTAVQFPILKFQS
jgi:hypothetical protein